MVLVLAWFLWSCSLCQSGDLTNQPCCEWCHCWLVHVCATTFQACADHAAFQNSYIIRKVKYMMLPQLIMYCTWCDQRENDTKIHCMYSDSDYNTYCCSMNLFASFFLSLLAIDCTKLSWYIMIQFCWTTFWVLVALRGVKTWGGYI